MKRYKSYMQLVLAALVFFSLFAFADYRNEHRTLKDVKVNFVGENNLFITEDAVDKLLEQSLGNVTSVTKETLDLGKLEDVVSHNQMVKRADVYLTVGGDLITSVEQRKPLARVKGERHFYIDDEGKQMPLSPYYSARVPLVEGKITAENREDLFFLLQEIDKDSFLKTDVVGITVAENEFVLLFRSDNFKVEVGSVAQLQTKIKKLKAFYQKAMRDGSLKNYSWVNLKYNNQVVCTKI